MCTTVNYIDYAVLLLSTSEVNLVINNSYCLPLIIPKIRTVFHLGRFVLSNGQVLNGLNLGKMEKTFPFHCHSNKARRAHVFRYLAGLCAPTQCVTCGVPTAYFSASATGDIFKRFMKKCAEHIRVKLIKFYENFLH